MRTQLLSFSLLILGVAVGCGAKDNKDPAPAPTPPPLQGAGTPPIAPPTNPPAEKKDPPVEKKKTPRVEIANAKITIDGKNVPVPCELADLEKALGKPSGSVDDPVSAKNRYVYWSGLGIVASQDKDGKQLVREFDIRFNQTYDLSTKGQTKPFPGEITFEGHPVTGAITPAELKAKMPKLGESFGSLRLDYNEPPIQIYINPGQLGEKGVSSVTVQQPLFAR